MKYLYSPPDWLSEDLLDEYNSLHRSFNQPLGMLDFSLSGYGQEVREVVFEAFLVYFRSAWLYLEWPKVWGYICHVLRDRGLRAYLTDPKLKELVEINEEEALEFESQALAGKRIPRFHDSRGRTIFLSSRMADGITKELRKAPDDPTLSVPPVRY